MKNKRLEKFLIDNNIKLAPACSKKKLDELRVKRKFSSRIISFYDTHGIRHYYYNNKDYRKKVLRILIDQDSNTGELPSIRRINNLKNIIRTYITKARILSERVHDNEIVYEILFTSNNTIKSYQYWIDELAYQIGDNSTVQLKEISLNISSNSRYNKIIPSTRYYPSENVNIIPINDCLDELDDFELATIGIEYQKNKQMLPPHDLAIELGFDREFFRKHHDHYENEDSYYAENFLDLVMHSKVIKK